MSEKSALALAAAINAGCDARATARDTGGNCWCVFVPACFYSGPAPARAITLCISESGCDLTDGDGSAGDAFGGIIFDSPADAVGA